MRNRSSFAALVLALAALCSGTPSALADEAFTAALPAGGSITTGIAVSDADPIQLTIHVRDAGTVTITKVTDPPPAPNNERMPLEWFGPRFDVSGDAVVDGVEFLVTGARVPPSGQLGRPRVSLLDLECLQENTNGLTTPQLCGGQPFTNLAKGVETPADDLRAIVVEPGQGNDHTWDLARHGNAGAGNLTYYLGRQQFKAFTGIDEESTYMLDDVLGDRGFSTNISCVYRCKLAVKATVSSKVARALGLVSPVLADAVVAQGEATRKGFAPTVPMKSAVLQALRRKRVTTLMTKITETWISATGEKKTVRGTLELFSKAGRFRLTCAVRGVPGNQLRVLAPKGTTVCP
jgi:hypothetical protein